MTRVEHEQQQTDTQSHRTLDRVVLSAGSAIRSDDNDAQPRSQHGVYERFSHAAMRARAANRSENVEVNLAPIVPTGDADHEEGGDPPRSRALTPLRSLCERATTRSMSATRSFVLDARRSSRAVC